MENNIKSTNTNDIDYFNKNINISYVDESLPRADNKIIIKHYLCSLIVYGTAVLLLYVNPFFAEQSSLLVKDVFKTIYLVYVITSPVVYLYYRPKSLYCSHNIAICKYIKRIFLHIKKLHPLSVEEIQTELQKFKPDYIEKQSLMLIFIKLFFGVLMINGFFNNIEAILDKFDIYAGFGSIIKNAVLNYDFLTVKTTMLEYKNFLYNNTILLLFTVDVMIYGFGYLTELPWLKNQIKSVETTAAGIFFCLICYPPFVAISTAFIRLQQNDNAVAFGDANSPVTWMFRIPALICLIIYVLASAALGTKASNLTNRGTVSRFPYNIVRHPAYISKNIFWILTTTPVLFVDFSGTDFNFSKYILNAILMICAIIGSCTVYYFRALTEERHLIKDPEYRQYVKKVKYRFIPFII